MNKTEIATSSPTTALTAADEAKLKSITELALTTAHSLGASQAEVDSSLANGFSVNVRMGDVETLEYHRSQGMSVTVYVGHQKGSASTSDLHSDAILAAVNAAYEIAKVTDADPYAGLADPSRLAKTFPDLDLYHPWDLTPQQAIEKALACEAIARATDKRITNVERTSISTGISIGCYGNSHGFLATERSSQHQLSCGLIASQDGLMQTDTEYTIARHPNDLWDIHKVANQAVQLAVRRLGAKTLSTGKYPVIFESSVAKSLIGHFIGAISGGNLYRQTSFLLETKGKPVFSPLVQMFEEPHLQRGLGSAVFDSDGVATHSRQLVSDGILQGYVLGSYSARKLGLETTGNANGIHNLLVQPTQQQLSLPELLHLMGRGLLITEVMGPGVNLVTGDYSRGAFGFWIENGQIQYPIEEITIAGNLKDLYQNILAIGSDIDARSSFQTGSWYLKEMVVAGGQ